MATAQRKLLYLTAFAALGVAAISGGCASSEKAPATPPAPVASTDATDADVAVARARRDQKMAHSNRMRPTSRRA